VVSADHQLAGSRSDLDGTSEHRSVTAVQVEPSPLDVQAVVVNFNTRHHLECCLASLKAEGVSSIVVVDNGSVDGSRIAVEESRATWLQSGENLGYGKAANLGARSPGASGSAYLLVCNPDVEVRPGALRRLVETLERRPSVALVGPRINESTGVLYPSARSFPALADALGHGAFGLLAPANRFTRRYRMLDWDHADEADVDWVSGACFLVRRSAWEQVGGFDPAFFMYMEDVDLCWRLHRGGWSVAYQPSAVAFHAQGVSTDRHPYRMLLAHHRSMWRYAVRTSTGRRRVALPLVGLGLALRLVATVLKRRMAGTIGGGVPSPLP
jgi:N-acetylglucosaminyl-diphospho-decaprenol L-rhamnosyltransferase